MKWFRAGNDELEEALDFTDAGDYATDLADSDDPADSASAEQGTGKQPATQKKAADQPMCSKKDTSCPKGTHPLSKSPFCLSLRAARLAANGTQNESNCV